MTVNKVNSNQTVQSQTGQAPTSNKDLEERVDQVRCHSLNAGSQEQPSTSKEELSSISQQDSQSSNEAGRKEAIEMFAHYLSEAIEQSHEFPSSFIENLAIEQLSTPHDINGVLCTHRAGPIFGKKEHVETLIRAYQEIRTLAPYMYEQMIKQIQTGEVAIIPVDTNLLINAEGAGSWGFVEKGAGELAQFKTAFTVDINAPSRELPPNLGHEGMHEAWYRNHCSRLKNYTGDLRQLITSSFNSADPCLTYEESKQLLMSWGKAYDEFCSAYNSGSIDPTLKEAGLLAFNNPNNLYSEFANLHLKCREIEKILQVGCSDELKQSLILELTRLKKEAGIAATKLRVEIPAYLMEAKLKYGQKNIEKIAFNLCSELDKMYGAKIFLESETKLALFRCGRTILKHGTLAVNGALFALHIVDALKEDPNFGKAGHPYFTNAVIHGSVNYFFDLISAHINPSALLIKPNSPSQTPINENERFISLLPHMKVDEDINKSLSPSSADSNIRFQEGLPFVSFVIGNMRFSEKERERMAQNYRDIKDQIANSIFKFYQNSTQTPESIFSAQTIKSILFPTIQFLKITDHLFHTLVTKYQENIYNDPNTIPEIANEIVNEIGKSIQFPDDYSSWSDEKKADWCINHIRLPSETKMTQSIDVHQKELEAERQQEGKEKEQYAKYLGDSLFWTVLGRQAPSEVPPANSVFANSMTETDRRVHAGLPIPEIPTNAPYSHTEYSQLSAFGPDDRKPFPPSSSSENIGLKPRQENLFPLPRTVPKEPPPPAPHPAFQPKPMLEITKPPAPRIPSSHLHPFGDVRIQPPGRGMGMDIGGSLAAGFTAVAWIEYYEIPQLLLGAGAPILWPVAFGVFVASRIKNHRDIVKAKKYFVWDKEPERMNNNNDVTANFNEVWKHIIKLPIGSFGTKEIEVLKEGSKTIAGMLKKNDKNYNEAAKDTDLPEYDKTEFLNNLARWYSNMAGIQHIIDARLKLEEFYTAHASDSPDSLIKLLKQPEIADDLKKRGILVSIFLQNLMGSEPISIEEATQRLKTIEAILPNHPSIQKALAHLNSVQNSALLFQEGIQNATTLNLNAFVSKLKAILEESYPSDATPASKDEPQQRGIRLIKVIGLKDKRTIIDLDGMDGINSQLRHISSQSISEMDEEFVEEVINRIEKEKKPNWGKRKNDGTLPRGVYSVLCIQADWAIQGLRQCIKDKEYWSDLQGKRFEELLEFASTAANPIQEQLAESALTNALINEAQTNDPKLLIHLEQFDQKYSDPKIKQLIVSLKNNEKFQKIFAEVSENPTYADVESLCDELQAAFPDMNVAVFKSLIKEQMDVKTVEIDQTIISGGEGFDLALKEMHVLYQADPKKGDELYSAWVIQLLSQPQDRQAKALNAEALLANWKDVQKDSAAYEHCNKIWTPFINYILGRGVTFRQLTLQCDQFNENADAETRETVNQLHLLLSFELEEQYVKIHNLLVEVAKEGSGAVDKQSEAFVRLRGMYSFDPEKFDELYKKWIDALLLQNKIPFAEDLLFHWGATSHAFPESACAFFERSRKPFIRYMKGKLSLSALEKLTWQELQKASTEDKIVLEELYLEGACIPHLEKILDGSSEVLSVLFGTVLKDLINHPTHIPGLGNYREEDFANNPNYQQVKKLIQNLKMVQDFDKKLLISLVLAFKYRQNPLRSKGLSTFLSRESSDFRLYQLKELFEGQNWTSRKHLASLVRLVELSVDVWKALGSSDEATKEMATSCVAAMRLLANEGKLDLFFQIFPAMLGGIKEGFRDATGREIESQGYYFLEEVFLPLFALAAAIYTAGGSAWLSSKEMAVLAQAGNSGYHLTQFSLNHSVNQAILHNINQEINEGNLESARKKIEEIKLKLNRADDKDLLKQLEVSLNFAEAFNVEKEKKELDEQWRKLNEEIRSSNYRNQFLEVRKAIRENKTHLARNELNKLKQSQMLEGKDLEIWKVLEKRSLIADKKKSFFQTVIDLTEGWLGNEASPSSSKFTPSILTLQQRGIALLENRSQLGNFSLKFKNLLSHFQHRRFIPHQLLNLFNADNPFAAKCHQQLFIAQQPEFRKQPVPIGTLRYFAGQAFKGLGYGNPQAPSPNQASSENQAKNENGLNDELSRLVELLSKRKDKELLQQMEQADPELYKRTLAFIQGDLDSKDLVDFLKTDTYIPYVKKIRSYLGNPANCQLKTCTEGEKYLIGWIAFLIELMELKKGSITPDLYRKLEICEICSFVPPLKAFCNDRLRIIFTKKEAISRYQDSFDKLVMRTHCEEFESFFTVYQNPLSRLLEQFNYDTLERHKKILIFFSLFKLNWKASYLDRDSFFEYIQRVECAVCQHIREVIGSREEDENLRKLIKDATSSSEPGPIREALSKGASPDLVLEYYMATNHKGELLTGEMPAKYLLHKVGEILRPDLIDLLLQFGANPNVRNLFDMNPLEHMLATVSEEDIREHISELESCIFAYLNSGIDPYETNSGPLSMFKDLKGSGVCVKIVNSTSYLKEIVERSGLKLGTGVTGYLNDLVGKVIFPKKDETVFGHIRAVFSKLLSKSNLQTRKFAGYTASEIAYEKGHKMKLCSLLNNCYDRLKYIRRIWEILQGQNPYPPRLKHPNINPSQLTLDFIHWAIGQFNFEELKNMTTGREVIEMSKVVKKAKP